MEKLEKVVKLIKCFLSYLPMGCSDPSSYP